MGNREHRRANKIARERKARALCKEYYDRYWRFGGPEECLEELEEPIFWGYRRFFVLRAEYAVTNNAHKWRIILEAVQNVEYSRRKDFRVRLRRQHRWIDREHKLNSLGCREFHRLIPSRWHPHFSHYYRKGKRRYRFIHREMFESRREKVYVTHRKVLDREWERRRGYLSHHIHRKGYERAFRKMGRGHVWSSGARQCMHRDIARRCKIRDLREMQAALLEYQLGEAITGKMIRTIYQTEHET